MANNDFKVSVIVPCYNEENNVPVIYEKIVEQLKKYNNYELIFVDDGSSDRSLEEIKIISLKDEHVHYIAFSRNFGHQPAIKAGLDYSSGDCVISMDADLQHPPELIHVLVSKWQEGFDVVYTIRTKEKDLPLLKKLTSQYFYRFVNLISETEIREGAADFRLLDKKVVEVIKKLPENYLFIRGLISWVGFKQTGIEFTPNHRHSGETKYSFKKMVKFASSGITAFSTKPLKMSIYIGFFIAIAAFIYAMFAIYSALFTDKNVEGWTSVIVSVLFVGGIQLVMIGIIGEYLGKLFIENKRRPNYIVSESNIKDK